MVRKLSVQRFTGMLRHVTRLFTGKQSNLPPDAQRASLASDGQVDHSPSVTTQSHTDNSHGGCGTTQQMPVVLSDGNSSPISGMLPNSLSCNALN